jgi:FAD/FMN-containing dehydrogenase
LMTEKMTDRIRKKLGKQIGDEKVVSSGDAYERSRKIWNARVMHRPDLIVLCENTADVQAAIKAATIAEMSISVRAGGHDWPGRCIQGQLVLDVTRLNEISIADQTCSIGVEPSPWILRRSRVHTDYFQ